MAGSPRCVRISPTRPAAPVLALVLASAVVLVTAGRGEADLQKPIYTAGDRWVYVLQGALDTFPGLNASLSSAFHLGFNGLVQVEVVGPAQTVVNGTPYAGVRVATRVSGYLNGTFAISENAAIDVSGTFSSDVSEVWEDGAYLPVASNGSSSYVVSVRFVIPTGVQANLWLNSTTWYASIPPFDLDIGDSAATSFSADLTATSSFSAFGQTQSAENRTTVASTWTREVLAEENITVEAGTFQTYRINESLGSFPGLPTMAPAGTANETAWFSNDAGFYVKRVAYVNGTPVAEMRLKSYVYPAPPGGLSLVDLTLLVAVPAAILVVLIGLLRRRKARTVAKPPRGPVSMPAGPPKDEGGGPP